MKLFKTSNLKAQAQYVPVQNVEGQPVEKSAFHSVVVKSLNEH